jgi:phage terminase large subunit GpA-like protein
MSGSKLKYLGESRDGRTNRWRIECPKCGNQFEPQTTRLAWQNLTCPGRKCNAEIYVNYNEESVKSFD